MASRVIREGLVTSDKVAAMAPDAQDRFPRYWLAADDFGCFLVQLEVIKGRLYPRRPDMTADRVAADLKEFERVGSLLTWRVGNKIYGWFTGWWESNRKPRGTSKRKTPKPPHPDADPIDSGTSEDGSEPELPLRNIPLPEVAKAQLPAPAGAVRSSQSQFAGKDQTPTAPASGGDSAPLVRLVKDTNPPPVKLPKRRKRIQSLAEELESKRQEGRDLRSRALHGWLQRHKHFDETLGRDVPDEQLPSPDEQLIWVQENCHCSPEEAADAVAIVAALSKPKTGARNG